MSNSRAFLVFSFSALIGANAQAALINEFQPNPFGSDPATSTVEIRGASGSSFSGTFVSIESDGPGAYINSADTVSGVFDSNGLLTVDIPDLANPSFTAVLVEGFTGSVNNRLDTNDDGTLDIKPWSSVHDAIGVPDSVADESWIYGVQLGGQDFRHTGDEPQLVFRDSQTEAWYAINDPDFNRAYDIDGNQVNLAIFDADPTVPTFGAVNPTTGPEEVLINEFEPNPFGSDPNVVSLELLGPAGGSFTGTLLSIDTDEDAPIVDRVEQVSGVFDSNGLLTVQIGDLENPSFTLALVDEYFGGIGLSIDGDGDGIADDGLWNTVYDAIGVPDSPLDVSKQWGARLGGEDFSYTGDEPKIIFRDSQTLLWYAINDPSFGVANDINANPVAFELFNINPNSTTFGRVNPTLGTPSAVPVPAAAWLFGTALLGLVGFNRRRKNG